MKVLVTGHRGFIGRNLVTYLLKKGLEVETIEGDLFNHKLSFKGDAIIHLAGKSLQSSKKDAHFFEKVNIDLVKEFGIYANANNIKFIFLSSAAVYGDKYQQPIKETFPLNPVSIYGETKVKAEEELTKIFGKDNPYFIFRLFNPFGIGQSTNYFIPLVLNNLRKDLKITIKSPNSIRDFIYIQDVCNLLYKALKNEKPNNTSIFNIGTGIPIQMKEVVEMARKKTGIEGSVQYVNNNTLSCSIASISKTAFYFDWKPLYSLEEGMNKYWASF